MIHFNMDCAKIENYCNQIHANLYTKFYSIRVIFNKTPFSAEDFNGIDDILAKADQLFHSEKLSTYMKYFAEEQGIEASFFFFLHCLGVKIKSMVLSVIFFTDKEDKIKVIIKLLNLIK